MTMDASGSRMGASPLPLLLMGPGPWGAELFPVKSIDAGTEVQPGISPAPTRPAVLSCQPSCFV